MNYEFSHFLHSFNYHIIKEPTLLIKYEEMTMATIWEVIESLTGLDLRLNTLRTITFNINIKYKYKSKCYQSVSRQQNQYSGLNQGYGLTPDFS